MLQLDDVQKLACPLCHGSLGFRGFVAGNWLDKGALTCSSCGEHYRVAKGLGRLFRDRDVRGTERFLRRIYDGVPWLHDPLVALTFPFLHDEPEEQSRLRYLARLSVDDLTTDASPNGLIRILEVSVGTGANVGLLRRHLPTGLPVEIWGIDFSEGMLDIARQRTINSGDTQTRLVMADAHALPFADNFFQRVFHVGGINGFRQPDKALLEMSRVAQPGTPIVVVDEQLDPDRRHDVINRTAFRFLTWFDGDPHSPIEHLPPHAQVIADEQIGPFFYCLTFRT